MSVKLPDGVGSPGLVGMLQRMRASPGLLDDFYRLAMRKQAEKAGVPVEAPRDDRTLEEVLPDAQTLRDDRK